MKIQLHFFTVICGICAALWGCASIPQSEYVHDHMDELWGITKDQLLASLPEDYLTYANVGNSRVVLKSTQKASYGNVVAVPIIDETVTYYFYNSRLYRISIESATNEFGDDKLRTDFYRGFTALAARYRAQFGKPAGEEDRTPAEPSAKDSGFVCGEKHYRWDPDPGRAVWPLVIVRLDYSCDTKPVMIIRVEEQYTHSGLAPQRQ
jgi:hypothetical protein